MIACYGFPGLVETEQLAETGAGAVVRAVLAGLLVAALLSLLTEGELSRPQVEPAVVEK